MILYIQDISCIFLVDKNMSKAKAYYTFFLVSLFLSSCSITNAYTNRFVIPNLITLITYLFSTNSDKNEPHQGRHPTRNYWFMETLFGLTGAILNFSVLYTFYFERQNLISAVNVMTRHENFSLNNVCSVPK